MRALLQVLETPHFNFSLDLAALASRREYLNLEKWLSEQIALHRQPFVQVIRSTAFYCCSFSWVLRNLMSDKATLECWCTRSTNKEMDGVCFICCTFFRPIFLSFE